MFFILNCTIYYNFVQYNMIYAYQGGVSMGSLRTRREDP